MKILYGVTGEGLGHAMRSRVVHEILRRQGHDVLVAASGRAAGYLARHGLTVVPIEGFELRYREGTLRRAATVGRTLQRAPSALRRNLAAFSDRVDPFAPDLCITDFDSFAHAYGKRRGLPVISVDHHHVITRCVHGAAVQSRMPSRALLTRGVVRAKIPGCDRYIASSFYQPPVRPRYAATTAAMACLAEGARTGQVRWLVAAPLVDYAIAQCAHRLVEKNRTQPYRNPPWHVRAELRMWRWTLMGKMDEEVARVCGQPARAAAAIAPEGLAARGDRDAQPTRVTAASTSTRPA
jgi:hypothetical protein